MDADEHRRDTRREAPYLAAAVGYRRRIPGLVHAPGRPVACPSTARCAANHDAGRLSRRRTDLRDHPAAGAPASPRDAAILFSDIVVPLRGAGIDLDIVPDVGPVIAHPIRSAADAAAIGALDGVAPSPDAVSLLVAALGRCR